MADGGFPGYPLGMIFDPRDDELIENYLLPKVNGRYDDYGVVSDADVFELNPKLLPQLARYNPGDGNLYFFASRTRSTPNGTRAKRTKDKRGWIFTDRPRDIKNRYGQDIGQKRLFVYKIAGKNTEWRLHEFTLYGIYGKLPSAGKGKAAGSSYLDLVLCRVWCKPAADKKTPAVYNPVATPNPKVTQQQQQYHQFEEQQQPSCSYSPEEECHQSEVRTNSVPLTANNYYTTLMQQSSEDVFLNDEEADKELAFFMNMC